MPVYKYRAATKAGDVVEYRTEASNRFVLMKKLKNNNLQPISVTTINVKSSKKVNKQKRNIESNNSVLKQMRAEQIEKNLSKKDNWYKRLDNKLQQNRAIKKRDIVVFTQNFYLLKKANFNNIQALTTVIDTIENQTLRTIVEDILLGVEAGENMYVTMELLSSTCFSNKSFSLSNLLCLISSGIWFSILSAMVPTLLEYININICSKFTFLTTSNVSSKSASVSPGNPTIISVENNTSGI